MSKSLRHTLFLEMPSTGNVKLSATTSPSLAMSYTTMVAVGAISGERETANVLMLAGISSTPDECAMPLDIT